MKNEKIGLTTLNWILSILGIIVLSCLIILPPVFRTVFKEEVIKEEIKEIPIITTTCYKDKISKENYTDNETIVFTHQNDQIKSISKKTRRVYIDPLLYQEEKQVYGNLVTAFSIITGYNYTTSLNDDDATVIINEEYDLKNFKQTTIIIPGDSEPTEINSLYQLNTSIIEITRELTTNSYVCQ